MLMRKVNTCSVISFFQLFQNSSSLECQPVSVPEACIGKELKKIPLGKSDDLKFIHRICYNILMKEKSKIFRQITSSG